MISELLRAIRSLFKTPGFLLLTVGTLGLAIGAVAVIFTVVDTVLLDPLPYDTDRLVAIEGVAPGTDLEGEFGLSVEFLVQFRDESQLLERLDAYNQFTSTLRVEERAERVWMSAPTYGIFETLGVRPALGRLPTAEDEDRTVLISDELWRSWFGADPDVVGKTYSVSGEDRTIIGVMPADFWFPEDDILLWIPRVLQVEDLEPGRFGMPIVARFAPGVTDDELSTELQALARRLPERFGGSATYAGIVEAFRPVIKPFDEAMLGEVAGPLWILLGSMGILLLIACANVANLFMARVERRRADLAVQRALGAGRGRLVFSQLAEAGVVAALAGAVAVVLARVGLPALVRAAPELPRLGEVEIGGATYLAAFVTAAVAALLCGLVPALRYSGASMTLVREGGRGAIRRQTVGRNLLVAAQAALTLVLLIGSALLFQSFQALRQVDPGYDTNDLYTFQIAPEGDHLETGVDFARFHHDFMDRVAALPGVESVGMVNNVPLDEGLWERRFRTDTMAGDADAGPILSATFSAGDYFDTMGIEVLKGRVFERQEHFENPGYAVVSRSTADLLWPGRDPIGQRLQPEGDESWHTVVGVVDDVLQYGFRAPAEPMVYFPMVGPDPETSWRLGSPGYVVRTPRGAGVAPDILALVRELAPGAPMYRTYTMEELAAGSMQDLSFTMLTLAIASILALVLGMVGLYGVLSYAVAQRTREIGLRMALGAAASRVRAMIVREGAVVVGVGLAVGAVLAVGATRALESLLFGVDAFDPVTYLAVAALMVAIGVAASYIPAWRASRVEPSVSLRSE